MGREELSYRREVIDLLKWVGLGERMDALPPILSGGEKQRAAIARAVISRPQLLLADEPTGNVDPTLGRRLLRLFIELNKSGTAVIIATHDITLMEQYDARRMVLHQGGCTSMTRIDEQRPLVDLGNERPQVPARARILSPIVPRASISGRALVAVVAIMAFLASITTGAVLLVARRPRNGSPMSRAKSPCKCVPSPGATSSAIAPPWWRRCGRRPALSRSGPSAGRIGQAARAVARHRPLARPAAGAARHRRAGAARHRARSAGVARARTRIAPPPASTITAPGSSACAR